MARPASGLANSGVIGRIAAFRRDNRGVSAVEFALIAPFMILTYFGLAELAGGMMAQRRVSHAASAVGDLVGQSDSLTDAQKNDIFAAASNIVAPFPTTPLKLRITSISGNASGQPRVDWSDGSTGLTAYAHCATVAGFPTGLISASGENVIMAEATYVYTSPVSKVLPNGLSFSEKFYLRPRKVNKVTRTGALTTACTS
jgi:Flp pilus assembly protein TadG